MSAHHSLAFLFFFFFKYEIYRQIGFYTPPLESFPCSCFSLRFCYFLLPYALTILHLYHSFMLQLFDLSVNKISHVFFFNDLIFSSSFCSWDSCGYNWFTYKVIWVPRSGRVTSDGHLGRCQCTDGHSCKRLLLGPVSLVRRCRDVAGTTCRWPTVFHRVGQWSPLLQRHLTRPPCNFRLSSSWERESTGFSKLHEPSFS